MKHNARRIHQVRTTDPQRRALWLRLFGVGVLPVKRPYPEIFADRAGDERLAYVLDARRLAPQQLHNLASYLQARVWGLSYQDAQRQAREVWTIDAEDVELVDPANLTNSPTGHDSDGETAVTDKERPFFVAGQAGQQPGLFMANS
jgi:hypothetical protein